MKGVGSNPSKLWFIRLLLFPLVSPSDSRMTWLPVALSDKAHTQAWCEGVCICVSVYESDCVEGV
jgi:hypothetical protein